MRNESFQCEHCKQEVALHPDGSARNHCPVCLYSQHVDQEFPGDRAASCLGLMEPVGIDYRKNKGYMIEHLCIKCKKTMLNKVAPDDHFLDFIRKFNKNRC